MNKTFRLAFMSSMLGVSFMLGMVPGLGFVLGMIPDMLVWTVCGFRYFLGFFGLLYVKDFLPQILGIALNRGTGSFSQVRPTTPSAFELWIYQFVSGLSTSEVWMLAFSVWGVGLLVIYLNLYFMVTIIRRFKRIRSILVRMGIIEVKP